STTATQSLNNLVLLANKYAVSGKLNGGNATLITETNDVFNSINNLGDIGYGMTQVIAGSPNGSPAGLGQIYSGTYLVSVDKFDGEAAADEESRISDAIGQLNLTLASFGVHLVEVGADVTGRPHIQLHLAPGCPV